jgi:hypothetical protein
VVVETASGFAAERQRVFRPTSAPLLGGWAGAETEINLRFTKCQMTMMCVNERVSFLQMWPKTGTSCLKVQR